jgi:DNA-binding response OmpR family regulator
MTRCCRKREALSDGCSPNYMSFLNDVRAPQAHFQRVQGTEMLSSQKLLIIEDVSLIALDIQRVVDEANAQETVFARNFTEAEALVDRFGEFDLAIVNPPQLGSSQVETAARLAAAGPAIVVCTATGVDLGATPFAGAEIVTKPFADGDLLAACKRALERRER